MTTKILSGIYGAAYDVTSPITTVSITASGYLAAGLNAAGVNAYTVVNSGGIRGVYSAVSLAGGGVVTNSGRITSTSTVKGAGVILGNGGTLTNNVGAAITGYYGVTVATQAGKIVNQGSILGGGKYGVQLAGGGQVTNGGTANTAASIHGAIAIESTLAVTVHNYGAVIGTGTTGIGGYLKAGGLVTNGSATDTTASIQGGMGGLEFTTVAGTLNNFGLIRGTGPGSFGAALQNGGTVTNGSVADTVAMVVGQTYGVAFVGGSGSVTNYGTIEATGTLSKAVLLGAGGSVTNGAINDTTALIQSSSFAIAVGALAGTVNNFGTVLGGYATDAGVTIYLANGGTVTNGAAIDTTARLGADIGVYIKGAIGTVTNYGSIGGANSQIGVVVGYGGLIVNGSTTDTGATIQAYAGAAAEKHAGTVINYGTILGGGGPGTLNASEGAVLLLEGGRVANGSSADTKAVLHGEFGILSQGAALTASNFGVIYGADAGVYSAMGGKVVNGSASDTTASIAGLMVGVDIIGAAGTVSNFGTISTGAFGAVAVGLTAGGTITNGSATDHTALIEGFIGVLLAAGGKLSNFGTISGNSANTSYAVGLGAGGAVTNNAGALIDGYEGIAVSAGSTVTNFGTIQALSGKAVVLNGPASRLNVEAGSVIEGVIVAGTGLVDVVGGVASANAIDSGGKIEGAGTLSLTAGSSFLSPGISLLVSKIDVGSGEIVNVATKLSDSRVWNQTAGTLTVATGDLIDFTGSGNTFSGTVTGLGTVEMVNGSDALTNLTVSVGKFVVSNSAVTLSGTIDLTKTLSVTTPNLIVANAGASLTGGGTILLSNAATNSIHGVSAAATVTNGDIIKGSGKLGGGVMTLINSASGTIESSGSVGLTIDTGANSIANAGVIEALTGGGIVVSSAVNNTGTLMAFNGTLTVNGAVTGAGIVKVVGGVADFTGAFNEKVDFGASGRLVLAHSQTYGGTIAGFSHTGTTSMDLADIAFSGATTATYSGTATAGVLTVSDGTHTANIHLSGNYLTASWELSAATGGGTHIIDPTAPKPAAMPLVAAMASFGATDAGAGAQSSQALSQGQNSLASPGLRIG